MKNSELLNTLVVSGKISNYIKSYFDNNIDSSNIDLYKYYNGLKDSGCNIDDLFHILSDIVDSGYDEETEKAVYESLNFLLYSFVGLDDQSDILANFLENNDIAYSEDNFYIMYYTEDLGSVLKLNGDILYIKYVDADKCWIIEDGNKTVYEKALGIEKDINTGLISVVCKSGDQEKDNLIYNKDTNKIKLVFDENYL